MKASFIKLYREELTIRMRELSDREVVLLLHCMVQADWDKKHGSKFGTFEYRVREIKSDLLPYWSIGKISTVMNSLLDKGFLQRISRSRVRVALYGLCRATVQEAETAYSLIEQGVQPTEQNVQNHEREVLSNIRKRVMEVTANKRLPDKFVQHSEQVPPI